MTGTILNAAAIIAGGVAGLTLTKELSAERQVLLKKILGIFTVWVGLQMMWRGLHGSMWQISGQIGIILLSTMLGKLIGQGLHIQKALNRLGQYAKQRFTQARPQALPMSEGFITGSILFCVEPLAILGALQDGLFASIKTLAIKSCIDGLTTLAFVKTFGWGVMLSAIPVLAYQGSITLLMQMLEPFLIRHSLLDAVGATAGFLVFSVSLVILGIKRIELGDYLPSLVIAPLLTWWWR